MRGSGLPRLHQPRIAADVLTLYQDLVDRIIPAEISRTVSDPDDDAVLACALAAGVDLIVSGDKRVLNLKSFQNIPILKPADAVTRIEQSLSSP